MTAMVARMEEALQSVESRLPAGFPDKLWGRVAAGCRRHAAQFQRSEA